MPHKLQDDDTLTISAQTYSSPMLYVKNLMDEELRTCVKEILSWNTDGFLCNGQVRNLCNLILQNYKVVDTIILTYLRTAVLEEAAIRWYAMKKHCCKKI